MPHQPRRPHLHTEPACRAAAPTPEQRRAHLAAILGGEGKGALPEADGDASPAAFTLRISRGQRGALPRVRHAAVDALNQPITLGEVLKAISRQHRAQGGSGGASTRSAWIW